MNPRRTNLLILPLLLGLLAACSSPQGPSMSAAETGAAIDDLYQAGSTVGSAAAWSQLPIESLDAMSSVALPAGATAGALPRGEYDYDQLADAWVKTDDSDDLILNWLHDAVAYRLTTDWDATAPTTTVTAATGDSAEVPTGAASALTKGGVAVGGMEFTSGWTSNACAYDEPTAVGASGYLGDASAMLTLDRFELALADTAGTDSVSFGAAGSATAGGDSLSAYLDVTANGQVERDVDCVIVDFEPSSGTVAFGIDVAVAGDQGSLDFQTAISNPQYDGGVLSSIGLDGDLRLDGVQAVRFSGALNDANGNGIPGDQLTLTFTGDESMTLEEFIVDQLSWGSLTALRLMLR